MPTVEPTGSMLTVTSRLRTVMLAAALAATVSASVGLRVLAAPADAGVTSSTPGAVVASGWLSDRLAGSTPAAAIRAVVSAALPGRGVDAGDVGRTDQRERGRFPEALGRGKPAAPAATGRFDVPRPALRAYHAAADRLAAHRPGCGLDWSLLAGVGLMESDHGRYADAVVGVDGRSTPRILGLRLNGAGPVAAIRDSDNGRLDGDRVWDRAVGPLQFIPQTWEVVGADGDRDGVKDPDDIDDAALAAGYYLCAGGGNLTDPAARRDALLSYNASPVYAFVVASYAEDYAAGVWPVTPTLPDWLQGVDPDRPPKPPAGLGQHGEASPGAGGGDGGGAAGGNGGNGGGERRRRQRRGERRRRQRRGERRRGERRRRHPHATPTATATATVTPGPARPRPGGHDQDRHADRTAGPVRFGLVCAGHLRRSAGRLAGERGLRR